MGDYIPFQKNTVKAHIGYTAKKIYTTSKYMISVFTKTHSLISVFHKAAWEFVILAYIVYSFGPMGTYIAYFVDPEGWASTMLQNGTTQEYINAMNDAAAWWVLVIMIVGTALIAWLSGLVGCKLLRKQFEKAGITA